ncbi:MAG: HAD-IA family hydrolase [Acidimicrobiales bacterium]|nr:HAD-IA family hydrolase [Acidimicrobiales bacterium]
MALQAIVFDFDGLILDTEWSVYQAIAGIYSDHGHELDLEWWRSIVGTVGGGDWSQRLEALVGTPLDHDSLNELSVRRHHEYVDALQPLPGVAELIDAAHAEGLRLAVASSSMTRWLDMHLTRLGLHGRFDALCGRDVVDGRAKPAPDVYLAALDATGVEAGAAVAIEDSPHGIAAAKAAGLACVAVPNRITAPGDFSAADLVVDSMASLTLADLQRRFG